LILKLCIEYISSAMVTDGDVYCYHASSRGTLGQNVPSPTGDCLHRVGRQTTRTCWTDHLHGLRAREEVCNTACYWLLVL